MLSFLGPDCEAPLRGWVAATRLATKSWNFRRKSKPFKFSGSDAEMCIIQPLTGVLLHDCYSHQWTSISWIPHSSLQRIALEQFPALTAHWPITRTFLHFVSLGCEVSLISSIFIPNSLGMPRFCAIINTASPHTVRVRIKFKSIEG